MDGRKRRWHQHRVERRNELVDGTIEAIRRRGRFLSMDDIAAEADVAKQTLYNQFGSKEELFRALIADRAAVLRAPLMDETHSSAPRAVLIALLLMLSLHLFVNRTRLGTRRIPVSCTQILTSAVTTNSI